MRYDRLATVVIGILTTLGTLGSGRAVHAQLLGDH
jgi:hypothetical protein